MDQQKTMQTLRSYLDLLLSSSDAENPMWNMEKIREGKPNRWNYIDGCMITAVLAMYRLTGEQKYLDFADRFVGWYIGEDGTIRTYSPDEYNLDHINPARNLFPLYDLTGKKKYRAAMDVFRSQLETMPRTREGNFWHKKIYPNQVWLDGLYMAQPFYMEYEKRYHNMIGCVDSFHQFDTVMRRMRDPETGLFFHGYDESRSMFWADPETGCSPSFWLRAMGWFLAAMVDVLESADEQMYSERRELQRHLRGAVDAMLPYQQEDGMFLQVIHMPELPGNYPETSGSALFAYAVRKAVRLKLLPKRYAAFADRAFWGTVERYLRINEEGRPELGGICLVAGLGGAANRPGTPEYYISEPVVTDEAKGVAPLLLAFTECLAAEREQTPEEEYLC